MMENVPMVYVCSVYGVNDQGYSLDMVMFPS